MVASCWNNITLVLSLVDTTSSFSMCIQLVPRPVIVELFVDALFVWKEMCYFLFDEVVSPLFVSHQVSILLGLLRQENGRRCTTVNQ